MMPVIPAEAGISAKKGIASAPRLIRPGIPAFAGMT
jgi:hypothetical protein